MKNAVTRAGAWVSLALLTSAPLAHAQSVTRFAGGRLVDDLLATEAPVSPGPLAAAADGSFYVVDSNTHRLLVRDPVTSKLRSLPLGVALPLPDLWNNIAEVAVGRDGSTYVVASGGVYQLDTVTSALTQRAPLYTWPGGPCKNGGARQLAVDGAGTIYFADDYTNSICKIVGGVISPVITSTAGFSGDGGPAGSAQINLPYGIAVDAAGNIFFSDTGNNRIRKINASTGIITTIAGNGQAAYAGENVVAATSSLNSPDRLAFDTNGNLYVAETGSYRIRRIDAQTGRMFTVAGNGTQPSSNAPIPNGVPATQTSVAYVGIIAIAANGDLLYSDSNLRLVRQVARDTGILTTIAGNGTANFCGETSAPLDACLDRVAGVVADAGGDVYISDGGNRRIRKVSATTGQLTTYAGRSGPRNQYLGDGGLATDANFPAELRGIALDGAGNLYVGGGFGYRLYRIEKATGVVTSIAGTGVNGTTGDGGPATAARIGYADGVAVDTLGNVYFSDPFGHRVRKIAAGTGIITTYAGTGSNTGPLGDGGPATSASLYSPMKLGFDGAGNLLIVDNSHNRLRKVDKTTGIITTILGNGTFGNDGDGGPATAAAWAPSAFATDPRGNLTVLNGSMRQVDAQTGIINKVQNIPTKSPDGFWLSSFDIAFDPNGSLLDATSPAVLKISGIPYAVPDSSPPTIEGSLAGALGTQGWYVGDVQVTWSVVDPESPVSSKTGCSATVVTQDTSGLTLTCTATSGGGTASGSVTLKRDATAPRVDFAARVPAPNANGWNGSDVSIPFTTTDDTSGIASTSETSPLAFANEGMGMSQSVTVTDNAGNTATYTSAAVNIDKTPPLLSADVSGTPGSNGWYVGDVQVGWSINEIPASIESSTGCGTSTVALDTDGTTFTCSVTSAGGTTSKSTTIKRDATAPSLAFGSPAPAPNAFGWYNYDTSIPFFANDASSGVASTSQSNPLTLTNEGVGLSRTVVVTDVAGNSASFASPPVNIDKTHPIVAPVVTGTLGNGDWYVSDVTVSWSIQEMPESLREIYGCETSTVTTDTDGVMFGCVVNSQGGAMGVPQWIKRDTVPPTAQWGAFSPTPNANGWNKTSVSVPYTLSDALSGVAGSTTGTAVVSAEGAGVTAKITVTDKAGNVATIDSPPRNIDKTAPLVTITSPANGATYGFYQDVYADYDCTDVSLLSCTGTNAEGAGVNTKVAGARTFKVTAKDSVAFTTAVTNSFTVASTFNFDGFLGAAPSPAPNIVRRGSLVPLRWRLPDGHGGFVTSTASYSSIATTTVSCPAGAVPYDDTATGGSGISFNAATNVFTYNWQSSSSFTGCKQIFITLKDGTRHDLVFKFQ